MRLLHLADVHLGYQQYNLSERFHDFGKAFKKAVSYGIEQKVDAILIAGDLFHKATVEPWAYIQAASILGKAREAGIQVIAVEGNHDQARYRDNISWLGVLAHEGYLTLLDPLRDGDSISFTPANGRQGGYVDLGHVRILGLPWLGSTSAYWLPRVAESLETLPSGRTSCTILLSHAGIEGEMPHVNGGWSYAQLEGFRESIDYVALGHMHKPFERDDWLHNPGSLETCAMEERKWQRGMYDITVASNGSFEAQHIKASPRPFFRERVAVGSYSRPELLYRAIRDRLREKANEWTQDARAPVVEVYLEGALTFDRLALDLEVIKQTIMEEIQPLHARVNTSALTLGQFELAASETLSTQELERTVLRELVLADSRYANYPDEWAQVMLDVKESVLAGRSSDHILEIIEAQLHASTLPVGEE